MKIHRKIHKTAALKKLIKIFLVIFVSVNFPLKSVEQSNFLMFWTCSTNIHPPGNSFVTLVLGWLFCDKFSKVFDHLPVGGYMRLVLNSFMRKKMAIFARKKLDMKGHGLNHLAGMFFFSIPSHWRINFHAEPPPSQPSITERLLPIWISSSCDMPRSPTALCHQAIYIHCSIQNYPTGC